MSKVKTQVGFRGHVKELEVDIPEGEPAPWGMDAQLKIVGTDVPRIDGVLKVTGRAKYTYDKHPKGMLWGKILHSPWGAATIKALDLTEAKASPGVRAVHVFKDVGRPLLYHGDEVLAIAADSEEQAEDAIRAVKVTFEKKDVATTIAQAIRPNAPMVFEGEKNVKPPKKLTDKEIADAEVARQKAQAAITKADRIFEATYDTQVQTHSALETHGAIATFQKDGSLILDISTQATFGCKADAVKLTELPDDKVHIVAEMVGGGFGAKFNIDASGRAAIMLAKATGKPVKVMLTREGEHTTGGCRPGSVQKMRAGVRKDGKIVGYTAEIHGTGGVSAGGTGATNPAIYDVGEKWKQERTVFTNGGPSMAMRSPAWPQGVFAMEGFLDEMADALGMDPIAFRKKNIEDEVYVAQWDLGAEKIGWASRNKVAGSGKGVIKRGMGMASSTWRQMGGPKCEVDVAINHDGSVETWNGAQDIGTGNRTLLAVIVAEELGLKVPDVTVHLGDTRWPIGPGSGGSKTSPSLGPAARTAAYQCKQKLAALAAPKLGVKPEDVRIADGLIAARGKSLTWKQAAALIPQKEPIKVRGVRGGNYDSYAKQVHGCNFAEVEVDTETGHVRVLRIVTIQDAGRVIDKLLFESQLIGGAIQGLSYALFENRILDRNYGPQVNADLMMYKVAGPMEMPEITAVAFDLANAGNNCGMMGLGEPPNIPTAAAIANAVYNAIGVRVRSLPITPDKVLSALAQKSKSSNKAAI
ncbi:MAG TPA: xanthine dehydrogenase family protein molybdopterin-binding subunit [Polyangia bacterium]|nr:xanthine dehydrogenase family protein molybdopterin-binding subunit [Polyangia bacterium]